MIVHTPALCRIKTSKKVDDPVFSGLDECTREARISAFRKSREFRAGIERGHGFA